MKKPKKNVVLLMALMALLICATSCMENVGEGFKNPFAKDDSAVREVGEPAASQPKAEPKNMASNPQILIDNEPLELDNIPVNRSMVAKMIALTMLSPSEIDSMEYKINFPDISKNDWYAKYINAAVELKYMSGGDGAFNPESPLSVSEAQILIDKLNPKNKLTIKMTEETKNLPISYALWQQLYLKTINELADGKSVLESFGLKEENIVVLATPGNTSSLPAWSMAADNGAYFFKGLNMDACIDKKILVYTKNREIVLISKIEDSEPIIENAYVKEGASKQIMVFAGGTRRTYVNMLEAPVTEGVADVKVKNGAVIEITPAEAKKTTEIMRITDKLIELSDGNLNINGGITVYDRTGGEIVKKSKKDLIVGAKGIVFYIKDGNVVAAVIEEKSPLETIRVLISNTDYSQISHTSVKISSSGGFRVVTKQGEMLFQKDDVLSVDVENNPDLFGSERIYIYPEGEESHLEIQSLKRSGNTPKYSGALEIAKDGDKYLIINTVDFEKYVASVTSASMQDIMGLTAMKVQAVAVRSSAYNQFYQDKYAFYGANVDDSVRSQLYNLNPATVLATQAASETKGMVMTYKGDVIKPVYFLVSAGYTANSGEVWQKSGKEEFPTATPDYLRAGKQLKNGDFGDLSKEENARAFLMKTDVDAFESDISWIRWNVTMEKADIEESINMNIKERYKAFPSQIKTLDSDGNYVSKPVESIGQLLNMEVTKRGEGGNIMEMKVRGTNGDFLFETENNIRMLIRPCRYEPTAPPILLNRADGSMVENYQIMPSAFYVFDVNKGENGVIESVKFYGGGNGHGVGMSQCGAKALADSGVSYDKILKHFYKGAELEKIE